MNLRTTLFFFVSLMLVICFGAAYRARVPVATGDSFSKILSCFARDPGHFDQACMQSEVHTLTQTYGTLALMTYLEASTTPDVIQGNCHDIGHAAGQESYAMTRSLEASFAHCVGRCRSGCFHGVVRAAMRDTFKEHESDPSAMSGTEVQVIGKNYCEQGRSQCHVVGHLLYEKFKTFAQALAICDDISQGQNNSECHRGIFMESTGGNNTLFYNAATSSRSADYGFPCNTISRKYARDSFLYLPNFQADLYAAQKADEPPPLEKIMSTQCEKLATPMRSYCFEGIGFSKSLTSNTDAALAAGCMSRSTLSDKESCMLGILQHYDQFSSLRRAPKFCSLLGQGAMQDMCYNFIFQQIERPSTLPSLITLGTICSYSIDQKTCSAVLAKYENNKATLPDYFVYGLYGKQP